jgi:hypothetical protein
MGMLVFVGARLQLTATASSDSSSSNDNPAWVRYLAVKGIRFAGFDFKNWAEN